MNPETIDAHVWSKSIMADYEGYLTAYPQCHPGWDAVLRGFFDTVRSLVPDASMFRLHQVKEKFGELRLYYAVEGVSEEVTAAIREAARAATARSLVTCEISGEPGLLINRDGYIAVRCERLRKPGDIILSEDEDDVASGETGEGLQDVETETVRIVDYLLGKEPPAFVLRPIGDAERMEREIAHCVFVGRDFDSDRSLAPTDIAALLVAHYGYEAAEDSSEGIELDVSMIMKNYEVWGRKTAAEDEIRADPDLHREHLAHDIMSRLAMRPRD